MNEVSTARSGSTVKAGLQRFGRFLSGMVMPNIGAFIAWGLITALFIPTGWTPNANLAKLVDPSIKYLLPLLMGYTGGKMVYGNRGAVVGSLATIGVIIGSSIPMFIGAMVMGPIGGVVIRWFDKRVNGKVKPGFEMLVDTFSAGILGGALTILGFLFVGPFVQVITNGLCAGMQFIIDHHALPFAALIVEPAKVLFLNNPLHLGILGPLGVVEAAKTGKSILFLFVSNPGPGMGVILAYWVFAKGAMKDSAPGAAIIHFLGGIHEIYFPYVLMNPITILGVIAGGFVGILTFDVTHAGLVALPEPGSIIAILALTPKTSFPGIILGVVLSTVVSFLVCSIFVKKSVTSEEDMEAAQSMVQSMKNMAKAPSSTSAKKQSGTVNALDKGKTNSSAAVQVDPQKAARIKKIYVTCEGGMGSSALCSTVISKKLKAAGLNIPVEHVAIQALPEDAEYIVSYKELTDNARKVRPNATHISISDYIRAPEFDDFLQSLK